jgi:23S rRNA pseudouridine2605 synthase
MRLNKFLVSCNVGSRRAADALISAGKVLINGQPGELGAAVNPARDVITVNGHRVRADGAEQRATLVLNKPAGVITTMRDERGRKSVAALLPRDQRLFPVGRLDAATSGVLLCTNDGELANFLLSPNSGVPRVYRVTTAGALHREAIAALGARGTRTNPDGSTTFSLVLHEGRNRQVRRMCARQGLRIISLVRTQFGPIRLGKLALGCSRQLTRQERLELSQLRRGAPR